ncbi:MAG: HIT family protein [Deltaproteobacteria bacterium]|nr:HIT family protein [Deltaproteobacteria bacterium]
MSEEHAPYSVQREDCLFCSEGFQSRIVATNSTVFAIEDKFPVTPRHLLIIPFRHSQDYFSLTEQEHKDAEVLLRMLKNKIQEEDKTVTGFNVGMNCGESAGQSIMHTHIHLIPRRDGDVTEPKGGIRGVIPEMQSY